jgi:elongation factor Ts
MAYTAEDVKKLRELTGAGMLDCKNALEKAGGNFDKAVAILKEKGFAAAAKKAARETAEGMVEVYMHHNKRLGALVELNCETDFVARTDDFKGLAQQIALQIAGANPLYISKDEVPSGSEDDPKDVCLLEQPFIQDESKTVEQLIKEAIAKTGENIRVKRFARFELGR